jgi:hypothetical protein
MDLAAFHDEDNPHKRADVGLRIASQISAAPWRASIFAWKHMQSSLLFCPARSLAEEQIAGNGSQVSQVLSGS